MVVAAAVLLAGAGTGAAEPERVSIKKLTLRIFVNPDASAGFIYDAAIENGRDAPRLARLLVRTPHGGFELRHVVAALDGQPLSDVRLPLYGDPGVELWLGRHALPPGGRGALHVELTMADMVTSFPGRSDRARIEIAPPWFDGQSAEDATDLLLAVHALPSARAGDLAAEPDDAERGIFAERPGLTWLRPACRLADRNLAFAATFPERGMTRVVQVTLAERFAAWFSRSLVARLAAGALFFTLYALVWHRLVGGRLIAAFSVVAATLAVFFLMHPPGHLLAFIPLLTAAAWAFFRRRPAAAPSPTPATTPATDAPAE
jgi:hypothetical protein